MSSFIVALVVVGIVIISFIIVHSFYKLMDFITDTFGELAGLICWCIFGLLFIWFSIGHLMKLGGK